MEEEEAPPGPQIDVSALEISPPGECNIEAPLGLGMRFSNNMDLASHVWRLRYQVDTSKRRKIVEIGETAVSDYPAGVHNSMVFSADSGFDVSNLPPEFQTTKDGLLTAHLVGPDGREVASVNMVVQIFIGADGTLKRYIFNPLE
mmetsp:Transcript_33835/g.59666  ORF Transcript_33835/g.59666 Transcript_33835/m.59666 type:complete len:145 (+) Transcript_33835:102-536(+)